MRYAIIILLILSCSKESYEQNNYMYSLSESVQHALNKRGVSIDLDVNMILKSELTYQGRIVAGLSHGNTIFLNKETAQRVGDIQAEAIIAHELGHNKLGLPHFISDSTLYPWPQIMAPREFAHITEENIEIMYDNLADLVNGKE